MEDTFGNIHTIGAREAQKSLETSTQRVSALQQRLEVVEKSADAGQVIGSSNGNSSARNHPDQSSLDDIYRKWDRWNEVETINDEVEREKKKVESLTKKTNQPIHTHAHEHNKEKKIFEMKEHEKKAFCEKHRAKGNYLFQEGLYPKAAEQYQLALSYYQYCFPGTLLCKSLLFRCLLSCLATILLLYYGLCATCMYTLQR